jgi:hypothetical protein
MEVIYTSALIQNKFDLRRDQYIKSYNNLLKFFDRDNIYITECFSDNLSFLKDLGSPTFITNTHNNNIRNKGVLEFMGIGRIMDANIIYSDMVLKITGRYKLLDDYFLNLVSSNSGFDFYGKLVDNNTQIFTGCFIINKKILIEYLSSIDYDYLEKNMINIERSIYEYLIGENKKCYFVDKLSIEAPIFGIGNIQTVMV